MGVGVGVGVRRSESYQELLYGAAGNTAAALYESLWQKDVSGGRGGVVSGFVSASRSAGLLQVRS